MIRVTENISMQKGNATDNTFFTSPQKVFYNIILPVPLRQTFTYHLEDEANICIGARVVVTLGGRKHVTGIVAAMDVTPPTDYQTKPIITILDTEPLVTEQQIKLWQWIADYYMCSIGEVMKAALPTGLKMENKSLISLSTNYNGEESLKGNEAKIYNYLSNNKSVDLSKITKHIGVKNIAPILQRLLDKDIITIEDEVQQKYRPKKLTYFKLAQQLYEDNTLEQTFNQLKKASKQQELLTILIKDYEKTAVNKKTFLKIHGFSNAIYDALLKKEFITEEQREISRFDKNSIERQTLNALSPEQQIALNIAKENFAKHKPILLHGVTASGKTEVYFYLIREQLDQGKQVLFLLPEIAITVEMLQRLTAVFQDKVSIYHSRYSDAKRIEVWRKINANKGGHLVIGARSAIFLPYRNLGLIIVDEEHEDSYKQQDPTPRYQARDVAVMLAHQTKANIILGSATPSIESAHNAQLGKYGIAYLMQRFSKVALPQIMPIDMSEAYKKSKHKHHFSFELINAINEALEHKEQIILFQNRRGYSGFVECKACGYVPQCPNCDISLTYHQYNNKLVCHYCGYEEFYSEICSQCNTNQVNNKGMGTEKVAEQAKELFPNAIVQRFDQDSIKGKDKYETIISKFRNQEINILVGTQMLAKGLDFDNVALVAIMNADNMMNFPDFRSHEKAYQMISQVAGRAGRRDKQGKVILQSFTPDYELIKSIIQYDYTTYYKQQIAERKDFNYPPFVKLIDITVRHRDRHISHKAAQLLANEIREKTGICTLGPEAPTINRIKLLYLHKIMLKIDNTKPLQATKNWLLTLVDALKTQEEFKRISVIFNAKN